MIDLADPVDAERVGRALGERWADAEFDMTAAVAELEIIEDQAIALADRRDAARARFAAAETRWLAVIEDVRSCIADRAQLLEEREACGFEEAPW